MIMSEEEDNNRNEIYIKRETIGESISVHIASKDWTSDKTYKKATELFNKLTRDIHEN